MLLFGDFDLHKVKLARTYFGVRVVEFGDTHLEVFGFERALTSNQASVAASLLCACAFKLLVLRLFRRYCELRR